MTDEVKVKHTAKDSVFTDLFSIPEYLLELYQVLHPEDKTTTVKDLKSVTCRCILAEHPYNDLGFHVGDRLIILVEAQSSWSPNIVLRLLCYWGQTLNNYFTEHNVFLYSTTKVSCPKPEFYVIYSGKRGDKPDTLSFKELYFPDDAQCDIDTKVHVIYDRMSGDIIDQYITFCKVLTEQVKKHGRTRKAIEEALRLCRDKQVLTQYLKEREIEIMNIMTTLFDQDYVTARYGDERERIGMNEGRKEGRKEGKKETAVNMLTLGMSMDVIEKVTGLTEDEIKALNKAPQNECV
ncbi:MAG: hypothetical protein II767_12035 [Proteobacteria bacterium]|nr:hypothetical protein [Pseudomonadota bacterium]